MSLVQKDVGKNFARHKGTCKGGKDTQPQDMGHMTMQDEASASFDQANCHSNKVLAKRKAEVAPEKLEDQIRMEALSLLRQRQFEMKAVSDNFFKTREHYEHEYAMQIMKQKYEQLKKNYDSLFTPLE